MWHGVIDETTDSWIRRYNKDLCDTMELASNFIKEQMTQWLAHIMRRWVDEASKIALNGNHKEKDPRGRVR